MTYSTDTGYIPCMDTTVKDIAAWARHELDIAEVMFGGKTKLYQHMQNRYGISEFTVRNFHKGEKDNPTQNMLDPLVNALHSMKSRAA